jgi:predicted dehydrogenase
MRRYNVGLIGYGGFGQFLCRAWAALPMVRIAAVADPQPSQPPPERLRYYSQWRDLVNDPDITVVAVVTPPAQHGKIAAAALSAGKHVLVEKPLALELAQGESLIQAARRSHRVATVDHLFRYHPFWEHLTGWSRRRPFGPLRRVVVENEAQDEALPPQHWFWDRAVSGGIFVEHGVHFFDLVHWLAGTAPETVWGWHRLRPDGREDRVVAVVTYPGGLATVHSHAFTRPGFFERTTVRLVFDLAEVSLEGWLPVTGSVTALVNPETERELEAWPGWELDERVPVEQVADQSRPVGWGPLAETGGKRRSIRVTGHSYPVRWWMRGRFRLATSKGELYADLVRAVLTDLIQAVENPRHRLRVTLEDGLAALQTALEARRVADIRR